MPTVMALPLMSAPCARHHSWTEDGSVLSWRKVGVCALAATLIATTGYMTSSYGGAGTADAVELAADKKWVTLVTGDRVLLDRAGAQIRGIVAGPGRDRTQFLRQRVGPDEFVIPADAVKLIAGGTFDRQLFNVSELATQSRRATKGSVKLIVRYANESSMRSVNSSAGQEQAISSTARMTAVSAAAGQAPALWRQLKNDVSNGRVQKVWLDSVQRVQLDRSTAQIGAPTVWQAGFTGKDVKVAVLDSGYDGAHPDLKDVVVESRSFIEGQRADHDPSGHGTHVASTVAGSGAAGGGKYKGVAPGAKLMVGKVCTDDPLARDECPTSAILAGMTWAAENGARVVNISLGDYGTAEKTPAEELVDTLTAKTGTLFVAAVGNAGKRPGSPASADAALAVGAADRADRLAVFSTQGPRVRDKAIKPDLIAPGERITAARSSSMEGLTGDYVAMSGTSMATPHVTGAAALVAQAHPDWKAPQIKGALMASAKRIGTPFQTGSGRVDVAKAVRQSLFAEPGSVSFGEMKWPPSPTDIRTQSVTLRNTSATSLSLGLQLADAAPGGIFSVPATVTVPANGTALVTVTATAPASAASGEHTATLVAQTADGSVSARVPIGLVQEPENYEHTITLLDRAGKPTTGMVTLVPVPLDSSQLKDIAVAGEPARVRLPRGQWSVLASFQSDANDPNAARVVGALADFDSRDHRTIEFDARTSKPVTITVPDGNARVVSFDAGVQVGDGDEFVSASFDGPAGTSVKEASGGFVIPTTGDAMAREFQFQARALFATPTGDGFDGATQVYQLATTNQGRIPSTLDYRPTGADFATVTSHYGRRGKDGVFSEAYPTWTKVNPEGGSARIVVPASGSRTTHFASTGDPVQWRGILRNANETAPQADQPRTYQPGQRYEQQWNRPMHTLALPAWAWNNKPAFRRSLDVIVVDELPLYSGGTDGHHGYLPAEGGTVELYENGTKIGEAAGEFSASFDVGFESADYRLVIRSKLSTPDIPSASSALEWTFKSSSTPARSRQPLPVSVAHLAPDLDAEGRAPAGAHFELPIDVQGQAGAVTKLTVEVSYDQGTTWTPATVTGGGTAWRATLQHPATADTAVSLRTHLVRADGGTTTYTQINAYRLR
jgi:subtilisin family serine protease